MRICEDIENEKAYEQLIKLTTTFVEEQVNGIASNRYKELAFNYFWSIIKEIQDDKNDNKKIYYVMDGEVIVAFEAVIILYDKWSKSLIGYKPCIFIKKEYRGRLIDGKFIAKALDIACDEYLKSKNIKIQRISTIETNKKHIDIYKKMGFREVYKSGQFVYFEK